MRKFRILVFLVLLCLGGIIQAQNSTASQNGQNAIITVTGTITDATDGSPLPGATITQKNTQHAAVTDMNGKYSIKLPENSTVVVQFLGMQDKEVNIGKSSVLDVALNPDSETLGEVIVTSGYGISQKGTFTGAASVVKNDKLQIPVTSFDKALQGNASGVLSVSNSGQPGAGQSVTIRGIGSIQAGTTPLYVVDGIPIATGNYGNMTQTAASSSADNLNALSSLNPNDIENITVLKDASATSIYGSRASNGVILITTKRGAQGKTQFDLKMSTGFSNRTSKNFKMLQKDDYINYLTDALVNAGYTKATTDVNGTPVNSTIVSNFPVRNANKDFYNFDWDKYAYNDNAPMYTVDFSVRGGNEKTQFYTSLSYLNQEGIVTKTALKRYSGRVNVDHKINDKVKFGVNVNMSYNDQESPMTTSGYYVNPVFASMMYAPIDPGVIDPGSFLYNSKAGTFADYYPENGLNINNMVTYANANFIANQAYDDFSSRTARVITGATVQWNILDELIFKGVAGLDYFYLTETEWKDPRPKGNSASYQKGVSETSVGENLIWNETLTLNYIQSFGKNNVNIMVGQETQGDDYRYVDGIKQDFPGTELHQISSGSVNYAITGSRSGYNLASFFATGNYNYDSRYFLSASIRRDGSSKLSKDNRWSTFWSVGTSWRLSNETFAKDWTWLSSATVRMSYGTTGNSSGIGKYAAKGLYSAGANYNSLPGTYPSQIANPNLSWEVSESFNIGLDFSLLNGRLGGTLEWYNRNTKELLLDMPLSYTSGFSSVTSNIGKIRNRGIEFSFNARPIVKDNFAWSIDFNITHNKNQVVKLVDDNPIINSPWIYTVGKDIQTFYTRPWAGVNPADGRPMWYDAEGNMMYDITKGGDNRVYCGSAAPDFYGGLSTRFDFYGVDLSLMFYYTYGNKIYDSSWNNATNMGYSGLRNQHESVATERWRNPGDIVQFPKAYYGYSAAVYGGYGSDRIIFDGSYIRLRDVTVGYTFPKKWMDAIHFTSIRLYMQASNLFTLTKFPDADPEVGRSGYYYLGYPNAKTITFGIDFKF
ncbi:MAG: TonB-dependent receptor [Bacteroidales bacterium]